MVFHRHHRQAGVPDSGKFIFVRPGTMFTTSSIGFTIFHAKQYRFKSLWYHGVRTCKGFQGVTVYGKYSKFSLSEISTTTWAPNIGWDYDIMMAIVSKTVRVLYILVSEPSYTDQIRLLPYLIQDTVMDMALV